MLAALRAPVDVAAWTNTWLRLVREGSIASTMMDEQGRKLRFGLRICEGESRPMEFCETIDGMPVSGGGMETHVGPYSVVLRANRALRPPAAPRLGDLPPHDEAECSMCSGPLALSLRPMVAQAELESGRCW
jgi:hypothetical protein